MLRSIGAVVAGYLVMAVAIMVMFIIAFPDPTVTPGMGFMIFSLAYGFLFGILGGWVCGLIARKAELKHAAVIAAIGILISILSMIFAAEQSPVWFQVANMVVLTIAVTAGGWLRARQRAKAAQSQGGTQV
jgi:hypothetical protein